MKSKIHKTAAMKNYQTIIFCCFFKEINNLIKKKFSARMHQIVQKKHYKHV